MVSYPLKNRAQKSAKEWFANNFCFVAACNEKVLGHVSTVFASVVQMIDTIIVFYHIKIEKSVEKFGSCDFRNIIYRICLYFSQTTISLLQFLILLHHKIFSFIELLPAWR